MSEVWVIEHGSDPRPARIIEKSAFGFSTSDLRVFVEFTDERGGMRFCYPSSVHPTSAEAVRAEREMEKAPAAK